MAKPVTKSKKTKNQKNKPVVKKPNEPQDTLPEVIGGPPSQAVISETGSVCDALLENSRLIIKISPCVTTGETGLSLFRMDHSNGWIQYVQRLNELGFKTTDRQEEKKSIEIACQAESFPTDTFSNEYGEHFLNQITDVAGQGFGQLAQMMGEKTATGALQDLGKLGQTAGASIGGPLGNLLGGLGGSLATIGKTGHQEIKKLAAQGGTMGAIGKSMDQLLAGARIDFPMIWKNSSYNTSYSFTVRLYNPNPGNDNLTKQYIIGPLAAILSLALPQGLEEGSYSWPFFCKVNCKGLFDIPMGAITNISVVKGGDTGAIGFNQRVAIVDVRIDFINLFNTLLLSNFGTDKRPTLKGYLSNMLNTNKAKSMYLKKDYTLPTWQTEKAKPGDVITTTTPVDTTTPPIQRTSTDQKNMENNISKNQPIIL